MAKKQNILFVLQQLFKFQKKESLTVYERNIFNLVLLIPWHNKIFQIVDIPRMNHCEVPESYYNTSWSCSCCLNKTICQPTLRGIDVQFCLISLLQVI